MTIDDINSQEKVHDFLQENALAILSTVSEDGTPYASPVYCIVDKELHFFFLTKSDTKKAQNIEKNNHVALTVTHPTFPIAVQTTGVIEEVQDREVLTKIAESNAKELGGFSWPPPISKLLSEGFLVLYKFTPNWLRVGDFSESKDMTKIPKNVFHEIIPHKENRSV